MGLADAHISMIRNNRLTKDLKVCNFGTGKGLSVLEDIKAFEKKIGITIPFKFTKKRKVDSEISYCSPKKALKELNWKAKHSIHQSMMDIKK